MDFIDKVLLVGFYFVGIAVVSLLDRNAPVSMIIDFFIYSGIYLGFLVYLPVNHNKNKESAK